MRSTVWTSLLLASYSCAQETVTLCESYEVTSTSTFTEYSTYYITNGGKGGTRPSTTIRDSSTSYTLPPASTSTSRTNDGMGGSRSSTIMTASTSKSALLPDDNSDPVTPTTPIPTSSSTATSTRTTTGSSTVGTTDPTVTSNSFVVAYTVLQASASSLSKRAILAYLAFDKKNLSILVSSSDEAAVFYLADGVVKSGTSFVSVDSEAEPTRFLLQTEVSTEPVKIKIENGNVSLSGVESYCLMGQQLVVVETGAEAPTECLAAEPQLQPKTSDTSSASSASSTSSATASSTSSASATISSTISTDTSSSSNSVSSASISETTTASDTSSTDSSTTSSTSSSETSVTSTISTSISSVSPSLPSSTTSNSDEPIVTNKAYIDTILRHHNRHRANHTADPLTWSDSMAATAKKIADTCVYGHLVNIDCPTYPDVACYGQNIGAGYLPSQMGAIISDGFYNGEVNYYTYYGQEPDTDTLHQWGHFSQIVWKETSIVGCYTSNCTESGLGKIDPASGIRPFFTVCNYQEPGNYLDEFADNVIAPLGFSTITANYLCPSDDACEDGTSNDVGA